LVLESVSSDQRRRERATVTRQITVLWCWGRIRPAQRALAGGRWAAAWAAAKRVWVCGADCTPVLMAIQSADRVRLHTGLARSAGAAFSEGDSSPGGFGQFVVRIFWWPRSVAIHVAPPIRCRRMLRPAASAKKPGAQLSSESSGRVAPLGPSLGGSRTRPLPPWTNSEARTLGQTAVEGLLESQITVCPLLHRGGKALLFPFLAPRTSQSGAMSGIVSQGLITPRAVIRSGDV